MTVVADLTDAGFLAIAGLGVWRGQTLWRRHIELKHERVVTKLQMKRAEMAVKLEIEQTRRNRAVVNGKPQLVGKVLAYLGGWAIVGTIVWLGTSQYVKPTRTGDTPVFFLVIGATLGLIMVATSISLLWEWEKGRIESAKQPQVVRTTVKGHYQ